MMSEAERTTPSSRDDTDGAPLDDADRSSLSSPVLVYTAGGNLEAHSVVVWLESNGVAANAVEDQSGASLFAFGPLSQFHQPQVFVGQADVAKAGELLQTFEAKAARRREEVDGLPPIRSECEECGETSEFPASQDGTTQNCPLCNAFMDVGTFDWPEDFDYGEADESSDVELSDEQSLDAAAKLDHSGDWHDAIDAYRKIAERWPDHTIYASNCIKLIQAKIDTAGG